MNRIKDFEDLDAWQKAHLLRVDVIKIINQFPDQYRYGLCVQMQKSSISIASNIAEGFGRSSNKEKLNFYNFAKGSATELLDQVILCKDLKLISEVEFERLKLLCIDVQMLINGLMRYLRNLPPIRTTSNEKRPSPSTFIRTTSNEKRPSPSTFIRTTSNEKRATNT